MSKKMSPLINPHELVALREDNNFVLIDVRTGVAAKELYLTEHLKGAFFVDLNSDLADIKEDAADGGRHPLPSLEQFSKVLQRCGIISESLVIAYDNKNGANAAARFWWMLKAAGHEKVRVLNGGFDAAVKAGFPVDSGEENSENAPKYNIENWSLPTANIDEVEIARNDEKSLVIDVREKDRYDGKREPLDKIAGHIPGAKNIPFAENLNAEGFFLSPEKLREKYERQLENFPKEKIIVHCGSGVTACHTLLALDYAGFEMPKHYIGSWSEWSNNNRPVETIEK